MLYLGFKCSSLKVSIFYLISNHNHLSKMLYLNSILIFLMLFFCRKKMNSESSGLTMSSPAVINQCDRGGMEQEKIW